ncbi:hypothetical protein ABZW18_26190 [Streptomyces sp. NPDC004647]|uniref:hypothetical protein n=1 Tax=Streptomyces sp. NPDC004647 TaxID=3154671 RepID=UPI0033BA3303
MPDTHLPARYARAAALIRDALALLDEDPDFGQARDEEEQWPATAEHAAVAALRAFRDALTHAPPAHGPPAEPSQPPPREDTQPGPRATAATLTSKAREAAALVGAWEQERTQLLAARDLAPHQRPENPSDLDNAIRPYEKDAFALLTELAHLPPDR